MSTWFLSPKFKRWSGCPSTLRNNKDSMADVRRLLFSRLCILPRATELVKGTCELFVCILSDPLICLLLDLPSVSKINYLNMNQCFLFQYNYNAMLFYSFTVLFQLFLLPWHELGLSLSQRVTWGSVVLFLLNLLTWKILP